MIQATQIQNAPLTITEQASLKGAELISEEQEIIFFKKWLIAYSVKSPVILASRVLLDWLCWLSQASAIKLRVSVLGGGCRGFQYRFDFATQANPDDTVIAHAVPNQNILGKQSAVTWLVDTISLNFLRGAIVDFKSDSQGERFILRGLKAKTTCSCGSSFDADPKMS